MLRTQSQADSPEMQAYCTLHTKHNIHLAIKIYLHRNPSTPPDLVRIEPFKRKAAFESDWAEVSRYHHDEEIYVHIRNAVLI